MWTRLEDFGGDQGDVVVLFVGTEVAEFGDDGGEKVAGRERLVAAEGGDEALFAKLFESGTEGFGDAVGVQSEDVAGVELALADFAVPIVEGAEDGGSGVQGFDGGIGAED